MAPRPQREDFGDQPIRSAPAPRAQPPAGASPTGTASPTGVQQSSYNFNVSPDLANMDQSWAQQLQQMYQQLQGRQPTVLDTSQSDQMRNAQTGLITDLQNQAAGVGPSLAQAQLQKANDQNLASGLAAIQSTRGMGATAAGMQAQGQQAQAGQAMAQDAAVLRLQEQMQARGMLGQLATGTRGQDIGQAAQQAQIQLQDRAQTDAIRNQLIAQGMNWAQAEQEARRQVAQMNQQGNVARVGADQNQQQITNQNEQFNRQQGAQETQFAMNFFVNLLKMLAGAGGGAAGAKGVTG